LGIIVGVVGLVAMVLEVLVCLCRCTRPERTVPVAAAVSVPRTAAQPRQPPGAGPGGSSGRERPIAASHLPTFTVTPENPKTGQCSICLQEFAGGDSVKTLPCLHNDFHTACIDQWLKANAACPLCNYRLEPPRTTARTAPRPDS
jgi:hypothetical protein